MDTKKILVTLIVITVLLSACGPSPADLEATAAQVLLDRSSTQTAQAPTATATFTPTAIPTSTTTPTATATSTPKPTNTPTITPTPAPALMALAPTLNDLPPGFVAASSEDAAAMQASLPDGTYAFQFTTQDQLIMGYLFEAVDPMQQASYDSSMRDMVEFYANLFGIGQNRQDISGLDEIGETRVGVSGTSQMMALTMRWDTVGFRRGEVVAILVVAYQDGKEPIFGALDFANLMDARITSYLSAGEAADAY